MDAFRELVRLAEAGAFSRARPQADRVDGVSQGLPASCSSTAPSLAPLQCDAIGPRAGGPDGPQPAPDDSATPLPLDPTGPGSSPLSPPPSLRLTPLDSLQALIATATAPAASRATPLLAPTGVSSLDDLLASAPPLRVQLLKEGSPTRTVAPTSTPPPPHDEPPAFVPYHQFKVARQAALCAPSCRSSPPTDDDSESSDSDAPAEATQTPLPALALPPLSSAPLDRDSAARLQAARAFVATGLIPSAAMRVVFSEDPEAPGDQCLTNDYIEHLTAWSAGWLMQARSTVLDLSEFLYRRRSPSSDQASLDDLRAAVRAPLTARDFEAFLRTKDANGPSCRAATEGRVRWLAAKGGFNWFSVFTVAAAAKRKLARSSSHRGKKTAPPLDLDELAHIALAVADPQLPSLARSVAAAIHYTINACHRYVTAQRCGALSSPAGSLFISGTVAADFKKAGKKIFDKPSLGLRTSVLGDDLFPWIVDSLSGVADQGFLLRDFNSRKADPFEPGAAWLDAPMSAARLARCLGHLLCTPVRYPDGELRRPRESTERLARLSCHSLRHFLPHTARTRATTSGSVRRACSALPVTWEDSPCLLFYAEARAEIPAL
ncbi:hypothetical protein AB1Y20_017494 [Prymnesium parvum]|uniref:Uncharacterized protein n=1 Tax=Prymnesium parvum TaxID=97485 RepID=A0AB34JMT7_PRYPA